MADKKTPPPKSTKKGTGSAATSGGKPSAKKKTSKKPALDPTFVKVVTFIFRLPRRLMIMFRAASSALDEADARDMKPVRPKGSDRTDAKTRVFEQVGTVRWSGKKTREELKEESRKLVKKPTLALVHSYERLGNKASEVAIFSTRERPEIDKLIDLLSGVSLREKAPFGAIRELHLLPDLPELIETDGKTRRIDAFSVDERGAVLVADSIIDDPKKTEKLFSILLGEEKIHSGIATKARQAKWDVMELMKPRLESSGYYRAPENRMTQGTFRKRPIIAPDTPIAGGIFLSQPAREAIFIEEPNDALDEVFSELVDRIRKRTEPLGPALEEAVLALTVETVRARMARDTPQAVREVVDKLRIAPDEETSLAVFVRAEAGIAEHKALLAGYLLERLRNEQEHYLSGKTSVDRNFFPGSNHVWVRYSRSPRDVYIVDPANKLVTRLDSYASDRWPYERQEDLVQPRTAHPVFLPDVIEEPPPKPRLRKDSGSGFE